MWKTIVWFVIALINFSCVFNNDGDAYSIGDNFVKAGARLSVVDSFSVNLSTVLLDSVSTSAATALWTGSYQDYELGKITSLGYFELGVPSSPAVEAKDRFDSLMLVMNYNSGYYGDTTIFQTLNVYRLTEELTGDENGRLWNRSFKAYNPDPIGSVQFRPRPRQKGTLKIRLSDQIGIELFELLKKGDETISTFERFREYFKGMVIGPASNTSAILGFSCDTSLQVVLHTNRIKFEKEIVKHIFPLGSGNTAFNRFIADRSGTQIENITKREIKIESSESGNRSFLQSGIGLMTRIDFPSMQQLMEMNQKYILLKAELFLYPEPGTYKQVNLPTQLVMFHSDKANRVISEIAGDDNTIIAAAFQIDKVYYENTFYKFDITDFLTTEIADYYFDPGHGLLIGETTGSLGKSLNRVVFSDRKNSGFRPVVKLYFLYYNL